MFEVYGYILSVFSWSMLAETAANRSVILVSCEFEGPSSKYVQQRLLLVFFVKYVSAVSVC